MKKIIIIGCIVLPIFSFSCNAQQLPPEERPPEVIEFEPVTPSQLPRDKQTPPEERPPEERPPEVIEFEPVTPSQIFNAERPPEERPVGERPPEERPPDMPKDDSPELIP